MERQPWEYRLASFGNVELARLAAELNGYGRAGWELVGLTTNVKKYGIANDLVAVFKRPGSGEVDTSAEPTTEGTEGWM